MRRVSLKIPTQSQFLFVIVLIAYGAFTGPALAQDPQWEIMLPYVHGPIAVDPTDSDVIYVAVRGTTSRYTDYKGGMLKSTDGGQTWEFYSEGWAIGTPHNILIHPDNSDVILVSGGMSTPVIKSIDGGKTWSRAGYGILGSSHGSTGYKLEYDHNDSTYYLAQDARMHGGLFRSKDGKNWQLLRDYPSQSVLIDAENNVIYVAGAGLSYLARSTDKGKTWESAHNGISNHVYQIVKVPGSRTLYVGTGRGIYKSYDKAESWISVNDTQTEQLRILGLAVSKTDTNKVIAAGRFRSDHGVFVSRDSGKSWTRMDFGIPDSILAVPLHLFLDDRTKTLFVNYVKGYTPNEYNIYRLPDALATGASDNQDLEKEVPESIELYQNYPNPFNPVTVIEYDISEPVEVTLRVYDVMGRLVDTLVDQMVSPGRHQATWNASNAASGTYIYRLRAGDFVQSRQMLLIK